MPRGGYREPSKPAAVSGPGKFSQRTDGGVAAKQQLPDAKYGEQKDFQEIQGGAPMGGAPAAPPMPVTPLNAPTARPEEPVTAGVDAGAGVGANAAGLAPRDPSDEDMAALSKQADFYDMLASMPWSHPSTRALARRIRAKAG